MTDLESVRVKPLRDDEQVRLLLMDKEGQRECTFQRRRLVDGKRRWPGVLIAAKVQYMGSAWIGACRAR
jgi:hypothetical protein